MYERKNLGWMKHLDFMFLDLVALTIAFWGSFYIRYQFGGIAESDAYRGLFGVEVVVYLIVAFVSQSHKEVVRRGYFDEAGAIIKLDVLVWTAMFLYLAFTKQTDTYSRIFYALVIVANLFLWGVVRFIWKKLIRSRMGKVSRQASLLVITSAEQARECVQKLNSEEYQGFVISGLILVDGTEAGEAVDGIPVVANGETLIDYVRLNVVDQVLIQGRGNFEEVQNLAKELLGMGIVVHISLEDALETLPNKEINTLGSLDVVTASIRTASPVQLTVKRLMDICGAIVGLVITALAFLFVAPAIYIKSPGPIFFSQERMGRNGRRFKIYKFRSMYMDAEERKKELMESNKMQGLMFKMDDDPRIIKGIGHFIRNTSIDELPQFWNILKGDMSLVGTRPPTLDEFEQYQTHHKIRLSFRPGLTGLWQVSGRSNITDFEEVVRLDEAYIAQWSIALDIKILAKTVFVVFKRIGSE